MEKQMHKYKFKAEVRQLLDILTHSLYSSREIFLRELLSNASDALEKLRFESLKGTDIADKDLPEEITISFDKDKKLLTVTDTGIGMTEKEIVKNIGTIAKSGTSDFLKKAVSEKGNAANIIGQFGVGFYSVFMVADEVVIKTRSFLPDAEPVQWHSDGVGSFEVETLDEKIPRGTSIEIHLKDDAVEFAEKWKLEDVIKKHSNFIPFPIKIENEQVNKIRAIWREPKFQLKEKDYEEFYKFLTYDQEGPLDTLHVSVDAPVQFNSIVFFPKKNYEMFGLGKNEHGLDLYVRRILIQHEFEDLLPEYLRFLRGVVDSEDIPLNVSRETLQENAIITKIRNNLVGQILSHLAKMAEKDKEKYNTFWQEFSERFKLGYTDYANQEKFAGLLRFNSSAVESEKDLVSLDDYIGRVKEEQKEIYYIFAQNREAIENNPHMEIFRKKGLEVLYLYHPVDEFVMDALQKYKDYELKSVEAIDASKLEKFENVEKAKKVKKLNKEDEKIFDKLLRRMKDILGDRVTEVKASQRLTDSPSCLVSPDGTMSSGMQKIMQLMNKDMSIPKKVMEVNPDHPLVRDLIRIYDTNCKDELLTQVTEQLYESALLTEGYLRDPHVMINRIEKLMEKSTRWYLERKQSEK